MSYLKNVHRLEEEQLVYWLRAPFFKAYNYFKRQMKISFGTGTMITNVVCCTELRCNINLQKLTSKIYDVEYNPVKFPAVIWKHKRVGGTCMVFANGKIVVNGKVLSVQRAKQECEDTRD